nr:helix-turn-helix transcriptional regulator [uncultured Marinifilum sp.]
MIKNRIVQLINSESLTSSKFADKIGVQRSSISHILSGRNKPSFDFIQKTINSFPHVNVDWIITGNGEMYKQQENSSLFDVTATPEQKEESSPTYYPPKLKKDNSKSASTPDPVLEMNAFVPGKQIEKVVVFYTDKTFREYNPS